MPRLAGIEGQGRVALQTGPRDEKRCVGLLVFDRKHWRRFAELQQAGAPVTYAGPAHTQEGMADIAVNTIITWVETPQTSGVRVHFVSTGAPHPEGGGQLATE